MNRRARFRFQLYVAGESPNSALATANLTAFCRTYLPGRYEIELVDVFREPKRAMAARIFMTPTLLALSPLVRRMVGTLTQTRTLLLTLGLEAPGP